ncbi:hypothetical protein Tdes44962_MAKER06252 [Teratosphaeria destructans]|uniref:DUF7918 domain-containing protein n=1 Tax=Teratosphaeria destructans TaxID=418781 RepID=A0A9W7SHT3_9PEZI|nr:hypothetical protein Tdes44962_MAKER06252 [Teratosphaeria destructans]
MAVHPNAPGLFLGIDVNGEDLTQYDETDQDEQKPHTIIKYVEAVTGAEFGISSRVNSSLFPFARDGVRLDIDIDGSLSFRWHFLAMDVAKSGRRVMAGAKHRTVEGMVKRPMLFAELTLHEDASDELLAGRLDNLGRIRIRCSRCRFERLSSRASATHAGGQTRRKQPEALIADGQLSEKDLKGKALTHQAILGDPVRCKQRSHGKFTVLGEPFAIFEFRYRSRAALRAIGILPRSPSPQPLSRDEVEHIVQGLHTNAEDNKQERRIKRERSSCGDDGGDGDGDGDGIQVAGHCSKKARTSEVIDLTDDD